MVFRTWQIYPKDSQDQVKIAQMIDVPYAFSSVFKKA